MVEVLLILTSVSDYEIVSPPGRTGKSVGKALLPMGGVSEFGSGVASSVALCPTFITFFVSKLWAKTCSLPSFSKSCIIKNGPPLAAI